MTPQGSKAARSQYKEVFNLRTYGMVASNSLRKDPPPDKRGEVWTGGRFATRVPDGDYVRPDGRLERRVAGTMAAAAAYNSAEPVDGTAVFDYSGTGETGTGGEAGQSLARTASAPSANRGMIDAGSVAGSDGTGVRTKRTYFKSVSGLIDTGSMRLTASSLGERSTVFGNNNERKSKARELSGLH